MSSTPEPQKKPDKFMYWICGWHKIEDAHGNTKWIVLFMEMHTRYVLGFGIYDKPTGANTIEAMLPLIKVCGVPAGIITNGKTPFASTSASSKEDNIFTQALAQSRILHIQQPDHLKKITLFWRECTKNMHRFPSFETYTRWYNEDRPHPALKYATPKEAFHKYLITELWDGIEPDNTENQ